MLFDTLDENFFASGFICIAGLRYMHHRRLLKIRGLGLSSNWAKLHKCANTGANPSFSVE